MITIREYIKAKDEHALNEVSKSVLEVLRKTYKPIESTVQQNKTEIRSQNRLVAEIGNKIVGSTRYRIDVGKIHIIGLMTHQEYMRKGVSRAIINRVKEIAL
jgi:mRNA-degrading endonuclease HigB of HigAB toxin-antitoxin module